MSITYLPCVDHNGSHCPGCHGSAWIAVDPFDETLRAAPVRPVRASWLAGSGSRWILLGLVGMATLIYAGGSYLTDAYHQHTLHVSQQVMAATLAGWALLSGAALVIGGLARVDSTDTSPPPTPDADAHTTPRQ